MLSRLWRPWNRSQCLHQAVERNLRHYQNVERAIFALACQEGMS
jgi:hypothetical protein